MCPCLKIIEVGDEVEFLRDSGSYSDWPSFKGLQLSIPGPPGLGFPRSSSAPSGLFFNAGSGAKENYGGVVAEVVKAKGGASFFVLSRWPSLIAPIAFAQPVRKTCKGACSPPDPLKRFSFL